MSLSHPIGRDVGIPVATINLYRILVSSGTTQEKLAAGVGKIRRVLRVDWDLSSRAEVCLLQIQHMVHLIASKSLRVPFGNV